MADRFPLTFVEESLTRLRQTQGDLFALIPVFDPNR